MAQYKVLQDIEAEDKLVGPLTLRQFIYAGFTAVCGYVCFVAITKHVYFMIPIFLLPGALTGFFAFPWGRDQPTEIWALAKIRFLFKPRRRIWNQSGVKQLVTVTAPKRIETHYTDGLSQTEVKSRLHALADTIDTRGWAIKNVTAGLYQPAMPGSRNSDRLIDISNLPAELPAIADHTTDMMDDTSSPMAQNFDNMMRVSGQNHRQQVVNSVNNFSQTNGMPNLTQSQLDQLTPETAPPIPQPDNFWFMEQPPAMPVQTQVVTPSAPSDDTSTARPSAEEKELSHELQDRRSNDEISHSHLHTILPLSEQKALAEKAAREAEAARAKASPDSVTQQPDPAIIALANNNDLNVATIARQAKRQSGQSPDEVVISLH
ncbi:MAG TPA: PrgI family protein [Candidatus Saccharimonadales bacterium]|nr:PrgI family protein [Candidatus Saccharimonadales bacterium]